VAGGPQGSFECVQQCGYQSLESLGVMGLKMNIKAKDDVYEATRQRMAVAEEESKKNWYVTHISLDTLTPPFEPLLPFTSEVTCIQYQKRNYKSLHRMKERKKHERRL
jgi:hypothetical protein